MSGEYIRVDLIWKGDGVKGLEARFHFDVVYIMLWEVLTSS